MAFGGNSLCARRKLGLQLFRCCQWLSQNGFFTQCYLVAITWARFMTKACYIFLLFINKRIKCNYITKETLVIRIFYRCIHVHGGDILIVFRIYNPSTSFENFWKVTILRKFLQILTVLKRFQKISNIQKFSKYFLYFYVKITSESPSFLPWLYFISHMFCSVIEILWKLSLKKLLKSNLLMCITDKKFPKKNQNGDFVGIWTFGLRYYPILQNIKKLCSERLLHRYT